MVYVTYIDLTIKNFLSPPYKANLFSLNSIK